MPYLKTILLPAPPQQPPAPVIRRKWVEWLARNGTVEQGTIDIPLRRLGRSTATSTMEGSCHKIQILHLSNYSSLRPIRAGSLNLYTLELFYETIHERHSKALRNDTVTSPDTQAIIPHVQRITILFTDAQSSPIDNKMRGFRHKATAVTAGSICCGSCLSCCTCVFFLIAGLPKRRSR